MLRWGVTDRVTVRWGSSPIPPPGPQRTARRRPSLLPSGRGQPARGCFARSSPTPSATSARNSGIRMTGSRRAPPARSPCERPAGRPSVRHHAARRSPSQPDRGERCGHAGDAAPGRRCRAGRTTKGPPGRVCVPGRRPPPSAPLRLQVFEAVAVKRKASTGCAETEVVTPGEHEAGGQHRGERLQHALRRSPPVPHREGQAGQDGAHRTEDPFSSVAAVRPTAAPVLLSAATNRPAVPPEPHPRQHHRRHGEQLRHRVEVPVPAKRKAAGHRHRQECDRITARDRPTGPPSWPARGRPRAVPSVHSAATTRSATRSAGPRSAGRPRPGTGQGRVLEAVEVAPYLRRWVVAVPVDVRHPRGHRTLVEPDDGVADPREVDDKPKPRQRRPQP